MFHRVLLFLFVLIFFNTPGALGQFDVSHLAGGPGGSGYSNGIGLNARFSGPTGIWGNGDSVYVADSEERSVRRVLTASGQVTTIAKLGQLACTSVVTLRFYSQTGQFFDLPITTVIP